MKRDRAQILIASVACQRNWTLVVWSNNITPSRSYSTEDFDVRFGSVAEICTAIDDVRFSSEELGSLLEPCGEPPGIGVENILSALPHQSEELRERFRGALLKAGFKP